MTLRKYIRLCAVSLLPLLFIGYVVTNIFEPLPDYYYIRCQTLDICDTYNDEHQREYLKAKYKSWFDVTLDSHNERKHSSIRFNIMATTLTLDEGRIVDVRPFVGSRPDAAERVKTLVGKSALVRLGIEKGEQSDIYDSKIFGQDALLYCNQIDYQTPEIQELTCYGDNWSALIKISFSEKENKKVRMLNSKITSKIARIYEDRMWYRISEYPMFIYLFFALSAITWLTKRAIKYVNAG